VFVGYRPNITYIKATQHNAGMLKFSCAKCFSSDWVLLEHGAEFDCNEPVGNSEADNVIAYPATNGGDRQGRYRRIIIGAEAGCRNKVTVGFSRGIRMASEHPFLMIWTQDG